MMTDQTPKPAPAKTSLWLRVLLFVSLAANVAVIGLVAGSVLLREPRDGQRPPPGRDYVFLYTKAFDEAQRRELGRTLRKSFEGARPEAGRPDLMADYRDTLALLRAEPFDRAGFEDVLRRQDARAQMRQETGRDLLVNFIAGLPSDTRRAYADRLEGEIAGMAARMPHHTH